MDSDLHQSEDSSGWSGSAARLHAIASENVIAHSVLVLCPTEKVECFVATPAVSMAMKELRPNYSVIRIRDRRRRKRTCAIAISLVRTERVLILRLCVCVSGAPFAVDSVLRA